MVYLDDYDDDDTGNFFVVSSIISQIAQGMNKTDGFHFA